MTVASAAEIAFDAAGIRAVLQNLAQPCFLVRIHGRLGATNDRAALPSNGGSEVLAELPPLQPEQLGSREFRAFHHVRYAYATGAMANGIASEALVIAMGRQRLLGSFGAAGLVPARIEQAIQRIQEALPNGPYAINLIHSPSEESIERRAVELFLRYNVTTVEASAFLSLTPTIVQYRAAGLGVDPQGKITIKNRVIAKVSRREVAAHFMQPAPDAMLRELVERGAITQQQAELAARVPVADDITAEADSGGHTDNRPLVNLLPMIVRLRDELQARHKFPREVRVGAGGGIGTPEAALAAFMMGAAYVVTGSVNQGCVEAGASEHTRRLLAQAEMTDVAMAPAADMFEMGVKLQVLKKGTLFAQRAQRLYDLYRDCASIDDIPTDEREKIERQVFQRPLEDVWADTVSYFQQRDPEQIERAANNPKRKMALIFRWYLGLSSRWSNTGQAGREMDYQIWCGPAMGGFNDWVKGSYLEDYTRRSVVDVAYHLMVGTAYLARIQQIRLLGLNIPAAYGKYMPQPLG